MRGHGGDVPASATDRPEQLGLGVAVGPDEPAVGRDHVGRDDAVAGEPVAADHPAEAAPERISEHAHVRRGAGEVGEAVLAGGDRRAASTARPPRRARVAPAASISMPRIRSVFSEERVPAPVDRARVVAAGIERDARSRAPRRGGRSPRHRPPTPGRRRRRAAGRPPGSTPAARCPMSRRPASRRRHARRSPRSRSSTCDLITIGEAGSAPPDRLLVRPCPSRARRPRSSRRHGDGDPVVRRSSPSGGRIGCQRPSALMLSGHALETNS